MENDKRQTLCKCQNCNGKGGRWVKVIKGDQKSEAAATGKHAATRFGKPWWWNRCDTCNRTGLVIQEKAN